MFNSSLDRSSDRDSVRAKFDAINADKQDFSVIYNQPDPRGYFAKLGALDYRIPEEALPIFARLVDVLGGGRNAPRLLDLGCSYGINAAAIRYGFTMAELRAHYTDPEMAALGSAQVAARDHALFAARRSLRDVRIVGLDIAPRAISYARVTGLLDDGIVADLETQALKPAAADAIAGTDLIISTGCIGYIGARSLRQIVGAIDGESPWIASFVLRMFPFAPIADALEAQGLVTEKLEGRTFRQRRFAGAAERNKILGQLAAKGISADGVESDGYLHAEFFLTRPAESVRALPLARLLGPLAGPAPRTV
ncbi:MAG: hypothetical protein KIT16_10620 [Rhodospirillaceae bacterium]|nr:hypothetical protein [Rhodospirillaceae bacterium]